MKVPFLRYLASGSAMQAQKSTQEILEYPTICKTAIADEHQYKITQAELDRFERQLSLVDREDPTLHPRLILGRINSFQRTIDCLKRELAEYEQHNSGEIA
jgi:hypothetical protein